MSDTLEAQLLRVNAAFYEAFASRDIEAMDELWARGVEVACVHPGWQALHGRDEVMASWRAILLGGNAPDIHCEAATALPLGDSAGLVVCTERIEGEALVATNTFVREGGLWHVAHHQSGPLSQPLELPDPTRLN